MNQSQTLACVYTQSSVLGSREYVCVWIEDPVTLNIYQLSTLIHPIHPWTLTSQSKMRGPGRVLSSGESSTMMGWIPLRNTTANLSETTGAALLEISGITDRAQRREGEAFYVQTSPYKKVLFIHLHNYIWDLQNMSSFKMSVFQLPINKWKVMLLLFVDFKACRCVALSHSV